MHDDALGRLFGLVLLSGSKADREPCRNWAARMGWPTRHRAPRSSSLAIMAFGIVSQLDFAIRAGIMPLLIKGD